jgi:drug/metabolite transporter (DMT)-like permease
MEFFLTSSRVFLIVLAAGGYALAAIAMKLMAQSGTTHAMLLALVVFFVVIVLAEVQLLRHMDLSNVYIAIIAAETVMVLAYAVWAGETLTAREIAGGGMVIAGTILVGG